MNPKKNANSADAKRTGGVSNLLQFRDIDSARKLVVAITRKNDILRNMKKKLPNWSEVVAVEGVAVMLVGFKPNKSDPGAPLIIS